MLEGVVPALRSWFAWEGGRLVWIDVQAYVAQRLAVLVRAARCVLFEYLQGHDGLVRERVSETMLV